MSADQHFQQQAAALGYSFDGPIKVGGNYAPVVRDGPFVYVSGQIPRVGDEVVVVGAAGAEVPIERARLAAKICTMRALALVGSGWPRQHRGDAPDGGICSVGAFVHAAERDCRQRVRPPCDGTWTDLCSRAYFRGRSPVAQGSNSRD